MTKAQLQKELDALMEGHAAYSLAAEGYSAQMRNIQAMLTRANEMSAANNRLAASLLERIKELQAQIDQLDDADDADWWKSTQ